MRQASQQASAKAVRSRRPLELPNSRWGHTMKSNVKSIHIIQWNVFNWIPLVRKSVPLPRSLEMYCRGFSNIILHPERVSAIATRPRLIRSAKLSRRFSPFRSANFAAFVLQLIHHLLVLFRQTSLKLRHVSSALCLSYQSDSTFCVSQFPHALVANACSFCKSGSKVL